MSTTTQIAIWAVSAIGIGVVAMITKFSHHFVDWMVKRWGQRTPAKQESRPAMPVGSTPPDYTEDLISEVRCRWSWETGAGGRWTAAHIQFFCPNCGMEPQHGQGKIHREKTAETPARVGPITLFICDRKVCSWCAIFDGTVPEFTDRIRREIEWRAREQKLI